MVINGIERLKLVYDLRVIFVVLKFLRGCENLPFRLIEHFVEHEN